MSPAAGGAAPAASFAPAPAPTAAIGAPPQQHPENPRDPAPQPEETDPGNAVARKTAWNVPPPPPPSLAPGGGGIMGGDDESWPALTDSAPAPPRAWPKSASSDSLSDGSAPSAPEDLVVVPPVPSLPVSTPISAAPSPASTSPPPSVTITAPSPQNGSPNQPDSVRHGGSSGEGGLGGNNLGANHGGSSGGGGGGGSGSTRSRSTGNNSSDGNSSSGGDCNWNDGGLGGGSSNMNSTVHGVGIGGSGIDSNRRSFGSNNWNSNGRGGGGSYNNGGGDEGYRNNGGSRGGGHWNNNGRSGSGSSNGFGGRGGRNRRDHDRGGNFSPRNYSRGVPMQQQQPSFYQPGPFQRPPPPPPPAAHFMMPQPYVPYVPPFAYHGDVQSYPYYVTPFEQQFQNMHLIQQPMQPLAAQQDQLSLQHDIQHQIEHYFSTNNLCHDTHLRGEMDDQGWVPIDMIATFPRMTRFIILGVDTNFILDSLQGSELLEIQGNKIRRRNDWATWLLHRRPPPSN